MDAGFLNFHKEEDFSSYFLDTCADDSSHSLDGNSNSVNNYHYDWDNDERELNGDVGLIPIISGNTDELCLLSSSPPSREDFNKIMNDWQHLVNIDVEDVNDLVGDLGFPSSGPPNDMLSGNNFDITKYVDEKDVKPRLGGKRIDMARRRYLIDDSSSDNDSDDDDEIKSEIKVEDSLVTQNEEDDDDCTIDVETVTDAISQPVLQAGDLTSLLEQFEATETTNMELKTHSLLGQDIFEDVAPTCIQEEFSTPKKVILAQCKIENELEFKSPIKFEYPSPVTIETQTPIKLEYPSPLKVDVLSPIKTPKKIKLKTGPPNTIHKSPEVTLTDEAVYTTLIKDQAKNKQILDSLPPELIDRIRQSSKRRQVQVIPPVVPTKKRQTLVTSLEKPKETKSIQLDHDYCSNTPRKDSGFSSCEEDDRSILRTQPTVKNADGKLMVSLLKTNTIKKKLNLEEYKKRLQNRSSQSSSGNNSPAPGTLEEDENNRRLRHQEMLMKMAQELILQQQNKDSGNEIEDVPAKPLAPPSNMVMKTLVSVGTNTEESWGHLEQILQNTQVKISPNSLISSIVEHLPKVKPVITKQVEHGEDKTIVYLDKEQARPIMHTVSVQTIHSGNTRHRRTSSSSSTSSSDSCTSSSSRESSCSRTPSPVRRRYKEQIKEVEERRVIYVGRIADNITRDDLRKRFNKFGPITNISVHFRRRADNYGFVTFLHKEDAYEAVERGNGNPELPEYDLSFGGRRLFCQTTYADLDNVKDDGGYWSPVIGCIVEDRSFDVLLKQAQATIKKRHL